jgi:hypothetical protein
MSANRLCVIIGWSVTSLPSTFRASSTAEAPWAVLAALAIASLFPAAAFGWGDEGHEIIARIADHYLQPAVRTKVASMLAADRSALTHGTGIAQEATWADKFRDADRGASQAHYLQTRAWHYIDIEIDRPAPRVACDPGAAPRAAGPASEGPAQDCILDKIEQFRSELRRRTTPADERRLAVQFLLHLVGDLHQPLHAADDHDHGGNDVLVESSGGWRGAKGQWRGNLHQFWDTIIVQELGSSAEAVAEGLVRSISPAQRRRLAAGTPADWARESFEAARSRAYGMLPRAGSGGPASAPRELDDAYVAEARKTAELQLRRAGVRLARVLNEALR